MKADVTLLTPTADQPTGFALCELYMAAQTTWDRVAQWIVADDGLEPARPTLGQRHLRRRRERDCTGAQSLCRNLLRALPEVRTEYVVIVEHDDLIHPRHLETLLGHLRDSGSWIAGDDLQRYYHVGLRQWRTFDNWGASLAQTGFRREVLPALQRALEECLVAGWRGVDAKFWSFVPQQHWRTYRAEQVVGIKGLPGAPGIGIGHRPAESGYEWHQDPRGLKLREWCGEAAENYFGFYSDRQAA